MNKTIVSLAVSTLGMSQWGGSVQLDLAQYPPNTLIKSPAPNVIVSVDDSRSMSWDTSDTDKTPRLARLKQALRSNFSREKIPDGQIRLAYQTMNVCTSFPHPGALCQNLNYMRTFEGDENSPSASSRRDFFNFIDKLEARGGTPSHQTLRRAGDYMSQTKLEREDPWGEEPGVRRGALLGCRKSYHIFFTDGDWSTPDTNGLGTFVNADGTPTPLPDRNAYDPRDAQTKVYADFHTARDTPTLADITFLHWARDLRPDIENKVPPSINHRGQETLVINSNRRTLSEYWNPKNDPATWQHLTTYTIGFGQQAINWVPQFNGPSFTTANTVYGAGMYGSDYVRLVLGEREWSNELLRSAQRAEGLWHAAINGRGQYIPAANSADLERAFQDILSGIITASAKPIAQATTASSSVRNFDTTRFIASYDSDGWTGAVKADTITADTGQPREATGWGQATTATRLDALSDAQIANRLILSSHSGQGISFEWDKLHNVQKNWLNKVPRGGMHDSPGPVLEQPGDGQGVARLKFLRGDRRVESAANLRPRKSRHGDVVNSAIWHTGVPIGNYTDNSYQHFKNAQAKRTPMIYVGANDGMLHGFYATSGDEKIAYIPEGVYPHLAQLTDPTYEHRYFVDGSPMTGDAKVDGQWQTLLVGTLGAGGKGFFVLNVTSPESFSAAQAPTLVVMDQTNTQDADIGHIMSAPTTHKDTPMWSAQITQLNNGRWAWVSGNGYNSIRERPVLLIQYLDQNKELLKIQAAELNFFESQSNGLSAPAFLDVNADGKPDFVYAGDLRGNLWKFDLSSVRDMDWKVSFGKRPFFTASQANTRQPITAAPALKINAQPGVGGLMVAFGTGRNLTLRDSTDASVQTLYAVHDNTRYTLNTAQSVTVAQEGTRIGSGRQSLVQQKLEGRALSNGERSFRKLESQPVRYPPQGNHRGWYLDLPEPGRRVLETIEFYDGSDLMEVMSTVPAKNGGLTASGAQSCEPQLSSSLGYRTLIDITHGTPPSIALVDVNRDGKYDRTDQGVADMSMPSNAEARYFKNDQEACRGLNCDLTLLRYPAEPTHPIWMLIP